MLVYDDGLATSVPGAAGRWQSAGRVDATVDWSRHARVDFGGRSMVFAPDREGGGFVVDLESASRPQVVAVDPRDPMVRAGADDRRSDRHDRQRRRVAVPDASGTRAVNDVPAGGLVELLAARARQWPERVAFRVLRSDAQAPAARSYRELYQRVAYRGGRASPTRRCGSSVCPSSGGLEFMERAAGETVMGLVAVPLPAPARRSRACPAGRASSRTRRLRSG